MSINDQPGRPSTARTNENVNLRNHPRRSTKDHRRSCGAIWSDLGSVQRILSEDLGMRRVAAKFVPKLLTAQQKQNRLGKYALL